MYKFINTFWDPQSKTVPVSHQSIHFQLLTTIKIVFYFHFHYFFMARILTHPFHTIHTYQNAIASISIAQNNRFWTKGRAVLSFSGHSKKKVYLASLLYKTISMNFNVFSFFSFFSFKSSFFIPVFLIQVRWLFQPSQESLTLSLPLNSLYFSPLFALFLTFFYAYTNMRTYSLAHGLVSLFIHPTVSHATPSVKLIMTLLCAICI